MARSSRSVVSADPFHSAAELAINPEPLIVTVVSPVPAVTALGVIPLTLGVGFSAAGGVLLVPPPPHALKVRQEITYRISTPLARFMEGPTYKSPDSRLERSRSIIPILADHSSVAMHYGGSYLSVDFGKSWDRLDTDSEQGE